MIGPSGDHAGGAPHAFDSFECAIHSLAPTCEHCGCRVIGHGVQAGDRFFCCAHCAGVAGAGDLQDRIQKNNQAP